MERCYGISEKAVFEILLHLPIMSLLRFKSVCKSWFSLIESSTFISEHLKYSSEKGKSMIIFGRENANARGQLPTLSGSQYEDCIYIGYEQLLWHPVEEVKCAGSCNGIVCIHDGWSDVALWNPALKQLRPLPQPLLSFTSQYFLAFGIDAANDFKVVKITWTYSKFGYENYYVREDRVLQLNEAEVYSSRDNFWRITHEDDALLFKIHHIFEKLPVLMDEKCFWMAHDCHDSMMLLSFDFNDEVFGTMALPDLDPEDDCYYFYYLDTLDDKLVYLRAKHVPRICEIWILHKYGVNESWNRFYNAELSHLPQSCLVGLSWNAEFLICERILYDLNWKLYLYNLNAQQGHFLHFAAGLTSLVHYTPSLVSLRIVANAV